MAVVRILTVLRPRTGGEERVEVAGETSAEILTALTVPAGIEDFIMSAAAGGAR